MPERLVPRAGLLPLILELYDRRLPELRVKQQELVDEVARAMEGLAAVQRVDICASKAEVEHVAWLARLELSNAEKDRLTNQLNQIMVHFEALEQWAIAVAEVFAPAASVGRPGPRAKGL